MSVTMLAPSANQEYVARSGTVYTADANSIIAAVATGDIVDLINLGCLTKSSGRDNASASTNPTVNNDNTQDYGQGSLWYNTTSNTVWRCISAATGAAVWVADAQNYYIRKVGTFVANGATNVTVTDAAIAITDMVVISLNTVGGTVGNLPHVTTLTPATNFTVAGTASDTSTYNYQIWSKIN